MEAAAPGVVRFYDLARAPESFLDAVVAGLSREQKQVPQKFLSDATGLEYLAQIRELPEYYAARAEMRITVDHIGEFSALFGGDTILIEIGGNSLGTRILLAAFRPPLYVPLDDSAERVREAAAQLHVALPKLNISGVCADYTRPLHLPEWSGVTYRRKLLYVPGSTIGNFTPGEAAHFLRLARRMIGDNGGMLVGVDLKKDARVLHAACNDTRGLTAQFNLSLLTRMNRELGADFMLRAFAHHAFYDAAKGRVEMHIRALKEQTVAIGSHVFEMREGETIHTATACKYDVEEFQKLAKDAGFSAAQVWVDAGKQFSIHGLVAS